MANARIQALLSAPSARRSTALLSPDAQGYEYEEDPRSLLTEVTGPILGAVGAVGNLLDLPGSMIRDTLSLNNPFDQLLSPFTADNRIDGRELLNTWGLASENKETGLSGWLDDPLEGVQDVAGFIAETALDPLNLLSRPAKVLGDAADAARATKAPRGLLANTFDPLRISELGEKMGVRSALDSSGRRVKGGEGLVRRGMDRTSRMLTKTADAIEGKGIAPEDLRFGAVRGAFSDARALTNITRDAISRNFKSMFDETVMRTSRKDVQPRMQRLYGKLAQVKEAAELKTRQIDFQFNHRLKQVHGSDIMDRLKNNTAEFETQLESTSLPGEMLIPGLADTMKGMGFSDDSVNSHLQAFREVINNTTVRPIGPLTEWRDTVEEAFKQNVVDSVPHPGKSDVWQNWSSTGKNRGLKEAYESLGWADTQAGDLVHEQLGLQIGRVSETGNFRIFRRTEDGLEEMKGLGNFKAKSKAIEVAHDHALSEAEAAASVDFDDISETLTEQFVSLDRQLNHARKQVKEGGKARATMDQFIDEKWAAIQKVPMKSEEVPWGFPYQILADEQLRDIMASAAPTKDRLTRLEYIGIPTGTVRDRTIGEGSEYGLSKAHRSQGDKVKEKFRYLRGEGAGDLTSGPSRVIESASAATTHQKPEYLEWFHGTTGIRQFYRDDELAGVFDTVAQSYREGAYKGKVLPSHAANLRKTFTDALGEDEAAKLFSGLTDPATGAIKLQELNNAVNDFVKNIDGPGDKWVQGGQFRRFHVMDNLLMPQGDSFSTTNVPRVVAEANKVDDAAAEQLKLFPVQDADPYATAEDFLKKKKSLSEEQLTASLSRLEEAREQGLPIYMRLRNAGVDGAQQVVTDLLVPKTESSLANRLLAQLKNVGKAVSEKGQSIEDLRRIQKEMVVDYLEKNYADVAYMRDMPKLDERGARVALDFRDGRTGNKMGLTENEYEKFVDKDQITSDRARAESEGLIWEQLESRSEKLTEDLLKPDGAYKVYRETGVFGNDPLLDQLDGEINLGVIESKADILTGFLIDAHKQGKAYPRVDSTDVPAGDYTIETLLGPDGLAGQINSEKYLDYLAGRINPKFNGLDRVTDKKAHRKLKLEKQEFIANLKKTQINSADWVDMQKGFDLNPKSWATMPGFGNSLKFVDAMTKLFKVGVLAWPGRITRDFTSAAYRSIESGMVDLSKPGQAMNSLAMGHAFAIGDYTKSAHYTSLLNDKTFRRQFEQSKYADMVGTGKAVESGDKITQGEAIFRFFRDWYATKQGGAYNHTQMELSDPLYQAHRTGTLDPMREAIPNYEGKTLGERFKQQGSEILADKGAALNPGNLEGMPRFLTKDETLRGKPRARSQFFADRIAKSFGQYTDAVTRTTAVVDQMRRGVPHEQAWDRANRTLVDYNPKRFSNFEKEFMKRVFPFYSFLSSQVPYVLKELINNPAGGLGVTIRAQRHAQDDQYVPHRMRDKAAIPLSTDEEGNQHYLESLGLMHEDAVAMLKPDLADIMGDMNPLLKTPVELATGRSLFMRGPLGGTDLSELDPAMGRIIQEVGERVGLRQETDSRPPPAPLIGNAGEHILSSSPAARLLSSTRTALDDRKTIAQRAMNLLTGVKVSTVSPYQQQSMLREELDAILKERGVRPFTRYSLDTDEIQEIEDSGDQVTAYKLRAVEKARAILDRAQRERRGQ